MIPKKKAGYLESGLISRTPKVHFKGTQKDSGAKSLLVEIWRAPFNLQLVSDKMIRAEDMHL